ncbi:unnamed protein product [Urochloa decumbens]|uniref:Nucleolar protein 58/56 N-terminal domain-containing protein n=1 Tax=Urochloa decumbens TaxID=240449 RepID=A0ABC8ZJS6_9POAL
MFCLHDLGMNVDSLIPLDRLKRRGAELGNGGFILVLFETTNGFAIFSYDGVNLYKPFAIENIWADFLVDYLAKSVVRLEIFETFDDKTSAINVVTGVNNRVATMIRNAIRPGQKLAVGNFEYKQIIEKELKIPCLFDKAVMELMWGLKNCIKTLLPGAPEPTKEYCLHMSEGMNIVLRRYELEVEPEMVNECIVRVAGIVYDCDRCVNKYSQSLRTIGDLLKNISNIDTQHWGLLKLGSALMILCNFHDVLPPGDPLEVFTEDEYLKLLSHGPLYEGKIFKASLKVVYKEMLWARLTRNRMVIDLRHYVREAIKEYKAGQKFKEAREKYKSDQGFTSKIDMNKDV